MQKAVASTTRFLATAALFWVSGVLRFPIAVVFAFAWCIYIWMTTRFWRERRLAALGFGLTGFGWWCITGLWHILAVKGEGSHTSVDGAYWAEMATSSGNTGIAMALAGCVVLAYADYLRSPKLKHGLHP